MKKSWMPHGVDSGLRPKDEEGVSPELQRLPWPLLAPLLPPLLSPSTPSAVSPTAPSPAWGEGEEHLPWVSWLSSAHHLKVQQALFHTNRILVAEKEEPTASSQASWLETPITRQRRRLQLLTIGS